MNYLISSHIKAVFRSFRKLEKSDCKWIHIFVYIDCETLRYEYIYKYFIRVWIYWQAAHVISYFFPGRITPNKEIDFNFWLPNKGTITIHHISYIVQGLFKNFLLKVLVISCDMITQMYTIDKDKRSNMAKYEVEVSYSTCMLK